MLKKWHPDRWTKDPLRAGEAKRRFQQIQEAYSGTVLFRPCVRCFSVVAVVYGADVVFRKHFVVCSVV